MPMVRVLRNGVIQIPKEVREEVGIEEGDYIDMKINGKDTITLHLKDLVDEDDSWYWSEGWQQMEREADEDIKAGRIKTFENIQDLIRELKE
jgi:AbrB family looped-hinge helix DNA binding protein